MVPALESPAEVKYHAGRNDYLILRVIRLRVKGVVLARVILRSEYHV